MAKSLHNKFRLVYVLHVGTEIRMRCYPTYTVLQHTSWGTSTSSGQFFFVSMPEETLIYIVQSERTINSHRKISQSVFKF